MTQEDLNEVMGKSLANYQLRQLAEDGGNLESALTLIDRLKSELLNAHEHMDNLEFLLRQKNEKISQLEAKASAYDRLMSGGKKTLQEVANFFGVPMEWTGREILFKVGEHALSPRVQNLIEPPDTRYVVRFEPEKETTDD